MVEITEQIHRSGKTLQLGVNPIEELFIEKMMKIAAIINKPVEDTITEIELLLHAIESDDPRPGLTMARLDWLIEYAAQIGELPQVVKNDPTLSGDCKTSQYTIFVKQKKEFLQPPSLQSVQHSLSMAFQAMDYSNATWKSVREIVNQAAIPEDSSLTMPTTPTIRRDKPKTSRNSRCLCGSGKKYKVCCLPH